MPLYPASQVAFSEKLRARADQLANEAKAKKAPKPRPTPPVEEPIVVSSRVAEIPSRLRRLEPAKPIEVAYVDPVFDTHDAAIILGVLQSRLEKWRQRDQGPDYLWYDDDYPRYELSSLIEFKASHRIRPSRQAHPGKRR
jgi:hypothetical protein